MWKWHFKAYWRKYCEQCQQLRVSVEVYILLNIVLFKGKQTHFCGKRHNFFFLESKPKFRNITLLFYFQLKDQSWNFLYHFNDSPKRNLEMKIEISFYGNELKKMINTSILTRFYLSGYCYLQTIIFYWELLTFVKKKIKCILNFNDIWKKNR